MRARYSAEALRGHWYSSALNKYTSQRDCVYFQAETASHTLTPHHAQPVPHAHTPFPVLPKPKSPAHASHTTPINRNSFSPALPHAPLEATPPRPALHCRPRARATRRALPAPRAAREQPGRSHPTHPHHRPRAPQPCQLPHGQPHGQSHSATRPHARKRRAAIARPAVAHRDALLRAMVRCGPRSLALALSSPFGAYIVRLVWLAGWWLCLWHRASFLGRRGSV